MNKTAAAVAAGFWLSSAAFAYQAEVLRVEGSVTLKSASGIEAPLVQGDLLSPGDRVETAEGASIDVAFDGGWNNSVRVEPGTSVRIEEVFPARLDLAQGGIYARLKRLPSGSEFQVTTPTAVAAARGTEYRTTFLDGQSQIYNFSESTVYVYGVSQGRRSAVPKLLKNARKIRIIAGRSATAVPQPMEAAEKEAGLVLAKGIEEAVQAAVDEGRAARIPSVDELETETPEARTEEKKADEDKWEETNVEAFSADMAFSGPQGSFASRFYTSHGKSRMEMPGGVSIVRLDRSVVWVLMPSEKMYLEQPLNPEMAAQAASTEGAIESRKFVGEEELNGKKARKYEVVLTAAGQTQTVYQWMTEGVPVPVKMQPVDGGWTVEYRNVSTEAPPDSLFEVPSDYQKMEMPALPQDPAALAAFRQAGDSQQ